MTENKIKKEYIFWTDEEIQLLKDNTGKMSFKEMSGLFKCRTPMALQRKSVKLGLISGFRSTIYSHNDNFFSVPTLENCWVSGFLASDGNINKEKNTIRLELNQKDDYILKTIKTLTDSDSKIFYYSKPKYQKPNEFIHCCRLSITSKQMVEDLRKNFNVIEGKTRRLGPPKNLTNEQKLAFIIGYVDGDGSINFRSDTNDVRFYICSSSLAIMEWIRDVINKNFNIFMNIRTYSDGRLYQMSANCKKALKIINKLRQIQCPRLARKWDSPKLLEKLEKYNLQLASKPL